MEVGEPGTRYKYGDRRPRVSAVVVAATKGVLFACQQVRPIAQ